MRSNPPRGAPSMTPQEFLSQITDNIGRFEKVAAFNGIPGYLTWHEGYALLSFAEERIFAVSPNVFLCVSAFNPRARQLYERRGFRHVGTLSDYIVAGIDEHLMRKTIGPIDGYKRAP